MGGVHVGHARQRAAARRARRSPPRIVPRHRPAEARTGGGGTANEHLDAVDGRYWLRLECRALARALRESGELRAAAVRDALAFRQARRTLYPANVESERALEITEGVASYTGRAARQTLTADAIASALDALAGAEARGKLRSHVCVHLRPRVWPPARCLVSRLDAQRMRSTDDLARAADACARRSTGHRRHGGCRPIRRRRDPRRRSSSASSSGRNASPSCGSGSWTVRCS